jgi:hypothetical protein
LIEQQKIVGIFTASEALWRAGDEYIAIVRFLLKRGADPNVLRGSKDDELSNSFSCQGTTYDQLTGPIAYGLRMFSPARRSRYLEVLESIVETGGHTSRPFVHEVHQDAIHFRDEIEQLLVFEDQIDSELSEAFDRKRLLMSPSPGPWRFCSNDTSTTSRAVSTPYKQG